MIINICHSSPIGLTANLSEDLALRCEQRNCSTKIFYIGNIIENPLVLFENCDCICLILHTDQDGSLQHDSYLYFFSLVSSSSGIPSDFLVKNRKTPNICLFGCGSSNYKKFNGAVKRAYTILNTTLGLYVWKTVGYGDGCNDFGSYSEFDPWCKLFFEELLNLPCEKRAQSEAEKCLGYMNLYHSNLRIPQQKYSKAKIESVVEGNGDVYLVGLSTLHNFETGDIIKILPKTNWFIDLVEVLPFTLAKQEELVNLYNSNEHKLAINIYDQVKNLFNDSVCLFEKELTLDCFLERFKRGLDVYARPSRWWLSRLRDYIFSPLHKQNLDKMIKNETESLALYFEYVYNVHRGRIDVLFDYLIMEDKNDRYAFSLFGFMLMSTPPVYPRSFSIANSFTYQEKKKKLLSVLTSSIAAGSNIIPNRIEIMIKKVTFKGNVFKKFGLTTNYLLKKCSRKKHISFLLEQHFDYRKLLGFSTIWFFASGTGIGFIRGLIQEIRSNPMFNNVKLLLFFITRHPSLFESELIQLTDKCLISETQLVNDSYIVKLRDKMEPQNPIAKDYKMKFKYYTKDCLAKFGSDFINGADPKKTSIFICGRSNPIPTQIKNWLKHNVSEIPEINIHMSVWSSG